VERLGAQLKIKVKCESERCGHISEKTVQTTPNQKHFSLKWTCDKCFAPGTSYLSNQSNQFVKGVKPRIRRVPSTPPVKLRPEPSQPLDHTPQQSSHRGIVDQNKESVVSGVKNTPPEERTLPKTPDKE